MADMEHKINLLMNLLPHTYEFERMQTHGDMKEEYEEFRKRNETLLRGFDELYLNVLLDIGYLIKKSDLELMDMEYCSDHTASGIFHTKEGKLCIFCPR